MSRSRANGESATSPFAQIASVLRTLSRLILGLVAIAACFGAWYVTYRDAQAKAAAAPKSKPSDVLAVEVATAQHAPVSDRIELVGSLAPLTMVEIRPKVGGYVRSLKVDLGDPVAAGAELVQLDDESQRESVSLAQAALDVTQAQLEAQVTDRDLARKTLERQKGLVTSGAGTSQQLEQAEAALLIADARIKLEQAKVAQAQAELLRARLALEDLKLLSPVKGVVAARMVDEGNLAAPDAPLMRIVDLSTVRTTVHVIEKDYRLMREGLLADVRVDAYPGMKFQGQVQRVAPVLDQVTRTADVRIDIPNTDGLLKPGMYARVSLRAGTERESLVIPVAAILDGQRPAVYVVSGTPPKADRRSIEVGATDDDSIEVTSGLAAGDRVITLGNRLVLPGQQVAIAPSRESTAAESKSSAAE
jgi:RND family efflux transporter MFP subunit